MKITNLKWIVVLLSLVTLASACSPAPPQTPATTRVATQTPWIIDRPVTVTPEPATITPLPTVTAALPTKAPTRAAPKATAKPSATVAPVAAGPTASATPSCSIGTVVPTFPENGAPRNTRPDGSGGSAIIFKWNPPTELNTVGDSHVGYMLQMESKRTNGGHVNGAAAYISANAFLQNNGQYIFDPRAVSSLAAGDDAVVSWTVTIVKSSGDFNDADSSVRPPDLVMCGSPSLPSSVRLLVNSS